MEYFVLHVVPTGSVVIPAAETPAAGGTERTRRSDTERTTVLNTTMTITDEIHTRRRMLLHGAKYDIGSMPSIHEGRTTLRRDAIPGWLHKHGCPVLFEHGFNLLDVKNQTVRSLIDLAAQTGHFSKHDGLVISTQDREERHEAFRLAALACSEFLRRNRTVAWRSAEAVVAAAPRRVEETDEDAEINDEFFEISSVYELLVIHGVQVDGYTPHEQRAVVRVLVERQGQFLPSIIIATPGVSNREGEETSMTRFLSAYYGVNEL